MKFLDKIFKKKTQLVKPETKPETKLLSKLEVRFNLKTSTLRGLMWSTEIKNKARYEHPWLDFVKWYHCRPQSKSFKIIGGLTTECIQRNQITGYRIYCVKE